MIDVKDSSDDTSEEEEDSDSDSDVVSSSEQEEWSRVRDIIVPYCSSDANLFVLSLVEAKV